MNEKFVKKYKSFIRQPYFVILLYIIVIIIIYYLI